MDHSIVSTNRDTSLQTSHRLRKRDSNYCLATGEVKPPFWKQRRVDSKQTFAGRIDPVKIEHQDVYSVKASDT